MRAAALFLALAAVPAAGQPDSPIDRLRDWVKAVDQHHAGEVDEALDSVCKWPDDVVARMRAFLESFVGAPNNTESRRRRQSHVTRSEGIAVREEAKRRLGVDAPGFIRQAAIFHTDVALMCPAPAITPQPRRLLPKGFQDQQRSDRRVDVLSLDAKFQDVEFNNLHWEVAMDMLDALPLAPRDPFIARWYSAIGAHFIWQRRFSDALVHFDRGRRLVPDDAAVLYLEGKLHEVLSGPRMQNFVRVTTMTNGTYIDGIDSERAEMRRAESLFQRALAANPLLNGARLRLGRVMMRQQRWEEGLALVRRVAAETGDDIDRYFASLFAGDAELALGRADAAKQSYERALAFFPEAQAARLGLADAIRANGDAADAIAALVPTLTKEPYGRADDDPWWQYYEGGADEVGAMIDALRAPFTATKR